MRATFVINLLFVIMIGNILYAQEAQLRRRKLKVELKEQASDLVTIESLVDLENLTKVLARSSKFFELVNTEVSEFKIPENIQISSEVLDDYLDKKMDFQEEFECVHCRYGLCRCNKKTLAEYIQDHSFESYKNLSEQLIIISFLKELKVYEYNESRKHKLETVKCKKERELKQQLKDLVIQRRRSELNTNDKKDFIKLILLLASAFFMGAWAC